MRNNRACKIKTIASRYDLKDYEELSLYLLEKGQSLSELLVFGLGVLLGQDNIDIPKVKKLDEGYKILTCRVSPELYNIVDYYAKKNRLSKSDLVYYVLKNRKELIENYIKM